MDAKKVRFSALLILLLGFVGLHFINTNKPKPEVDLQNEGVKTGVETKLRASPTPRLVDSTSTPSQPKSLEGLITVNTLRQQFNSFSSDQELDRLKMLMNLIYETGQREVIKEFAYKELELAKSRVGSPLTTQAATILMYLYLSNSNDESSVKIRVEKIIADEISPYKQEVYRNLFRNFMAHDEAQMKRAMYSELRDI